MSKDSMRCGHVCMRFVRIEKKLNPWEFWSNQDIILIEDPVTKMMAIVWLNKTLRWNVND